jgi:glycosyltransferase involved in cell wall biosynthesis
LVIAGDGSLRKKLEKFAFGNHISDRVIVPVEDELFFSEKHLNLSTVSFLGSRNDIPDLLHQSSVFILSTTPGEGFGTVLLEALASGLQVIASDVPACREVLKNGKYGILVPFNDPDALSVAIIRAFKNPISEKQRQENIKYASSFTPQKMMKEYLRIVGINVNDN